MSAIAVTAPGKAILCGEYAVLHGAPAIAVAVNRRVRATFVRQGAGNKTAFVAEAVARASRVLDRRFHDVIVDSSALHEGDHKLGLGSSAAATAATVGLLFAELDRSLQGEAPRIFEIADSAHSHAQGTRGSGIDVAVSVYGGTIRFQKKNGESQIQVAQLPKALRLTFVYTGKPASTPELLAKVKQFAEAQPAAHDAAIARLSAQALGFAQAVAAGDTKALVEAASAYGEAMAHLGRSSGAEIVTQAHATIAALARRHGGAAKPSGAGGGDLAVCFTLGENDTRALRQDLNVAGLPPLDLGAQAPGLSREILK
jgi:phosphomevalonate kinase